MTSYRTPITLAAVSFAFALVAFSGRAHAQLRAADVECKKNETQAECFKRLKCKADEELEACQKRLLKCNAGESLDDCKKRVGNGGGGAQGNQGNQGGNRNDERSGREQENRDQGNRDQGNRDQGNRDQGDRGREERERQEREREERERANDRRRENRDEDNGRDRGRRGGGGDGGSRGRRRAGGGGGGGFEANKTFGLGLELGEPSGLTGKVFVSHNTAIDFGLGYIYDQYYYRRGDGLHLYADLLFHPVVLAHANAFELPLYVGPGIRFWDFSYCDPAPSRVCYSDGRAIGIRVPVGIDFDFNNVPLDIFIQLVPTLDFLNRDYYNRYNVNHEHFGIDFSVGARFWFK